jgi:tetratricopeptide (TPR) repeat protein
MSQYRSAAAEREFVEAGRFVEHLEYLAEASPRAEMGYSVTDATIRACIESGDFKRAEDIINDRINEYSRKKNNDRLAQCWYSMAYLRNEQGRTDEEIGALEKAIQFIPEFPEALYNWGNTLVKLAHTKQGAEQERLFHLAFEKYEAAIKVKPDKHKALYNWGVALGDLARTKQGAEQERLFEIAFQKISDAIRIVSSQDNREIASFYAGHFMHITLLRCEIAVKAENIGQTRNMFKLALDQVPIAGEDLALFELFTFFTNVLKEPTVGICAELFGLMQKRNLKKPLGVLEPLSKAIEYWQKDEKTRDEVLDRLNPEVREAVEAIIQGDSTEIS